MHQRPLADPYHKDSELGAASCGAAVAVTAAQMEDEASEQVGSGYHGEAPSSADGAVDLFDDVFGESQETTVATTAGAITDTTTTTTSTPVTPIATAHPSDMYRLQHHATTVGYREGLAAAKAASIQDGFDEGYALGAAIGSVVGELLGLLEGLVGGTASSLSSPSLPGIVDSDPPLQRLLLDAQSQLSMQAVFGPTYFAPDGTWLYEVNPETVKGSDNRKDGSDEASGQVVGRSQSPCEPTIFDVAQAHPLVRSWRSIVDVQLRRCGVCWGDASTEMVLAEMLGLQENKEGDGGKEEKGTTDSEAATQSIARPPPFSNTALDW